MRILGISGAKGSGKSTAASMAAGIVHNSEIASLADPMKKICEDVFQFSQTQLHGSSRHRDKIDPEWGFSPRIALQKLGTEWGRKLHEDTWIRYLCRDIHSRSGLLIIPDIRYDNEARFIRQHRGEIIQLRRNERPWWRPSLSYHTSERGISPVLVDRVIDNRGTSLAELRNQIRNYCELLFL